MSDYALFYNSVNGDRKYDADDFSNWLKKFYTTGVFNGDLAVTSAGNMAVTVGSGYVNIEGKVKQFSEETTLTLDVASSTYKRVDTIVVERNDTDRDITIKVVTGTASGSATEPVRSGGIYQLVLAQITVAAGVASISDSNIYDTRSLSDICGIVTGAVTQFDFDTFKNQFDVFYEEAQANFSNWFTNAQVQSDNVLFVSYTEDSEYQLPLNTINDNETSEESTWSSQKINNAIKAALAETLYPVGSIYMSTTNTDPSTYFGGSWEAWGSGRVPVGVNASDSDFNSVGKTGGAKTVASSGTIGGTALSVSQIPSHSHSIPALSGSTNAAGAGSVRMNMLGERAGTTVLMNNASGTVSVSTTDSVIARISSNNYTVNSGVSSDTLNIANHSHTVTTNANATGSQGSGGTHTHSYTGKATSVLQPYITCYMWKRIA